MLTNLTKHLKLIILAVFAFILTGCAQMDYSRIVFANGRVQDRVVITLDTDKIKAAGYSTNSLLTVIQNDLELYFLSGVRSFKSESQSNINFTEEQKNLINNSILSSVDITADLKKVVATITFENNEVFDMYYTWQKQQNETPEEEPASNVIVKKGFYFNTYIQTSSTAYGDIINSFFYEKYSTDLGLSQHFTLNDISFSQIYASNNLALKSNALYTEVNSGIKFHYWQVNPLNNNQTLEFYAYSPQTTSWYVTALAISLLAVIIIFAYNLFNKKPQHKTKIDFV